MFSILKTLLLFLLLIFTNNSFADDDNGLPEVYEINGKKLMDGKTAIHIHFTDIIEERYIVDVEWFPDNGLMPLWTGPATIIFNTKDGALSLFTISTGFFHIPNFKWDWKKIYNGEVFEMKYSDFKRYSTLKELTSKKSIWSVGIPFLFEDVNFDSTKELIIVKKRAGQRWTDDYEVYSIDEFGALNSPYNITNSMPYVEFDGFTKFNPEDKTIALYYSGGACSSSSETYQAADGYGAVKFQLINGWETYSWDDDGNDIGCHVKTYDIVNGREVLNVAESGAVDLATGELINRI